jgi:hypothetical protein
MLDSLIELVPELFYTIVAGALATFGLGVEYMAAQSVISGETTVGLWMLFVGLIALYASIQLAREKALPAVRSAAP